MFKKFLVTGILIWIPVLITVLFVRLILNLGDYSLLVLPVSYRPDSLFGFKIPGSGIIFLFLMVFITGILATNVFGRSIVNLWESVLSRIPLIRGIYYGVKQSLKVYFTTDKAFQKVVLVEYPRKGCWSIAFVTNYEKANSHFDEPMVTLFLSTTPNPTSGYILLVPESQVHFLDMSVDDAVKFVISLGTVSDLFPKEIKKENKEGK